MTGTSIVATPAASDRQRNRLVFGREIWEWIGSLSGLAFLALSLAGMSIADPNSPGRDINPDQASAPIADLLVESRDDGRIGIAILMVAIFCLFWFVGYIYQRLQTSEGEHGYLPIVALGGGLVTAAAMLVTLHTEVGLYSVSDYGDETVVARTLAALAWDSVIVLAVPIAVFVAAVSLSALLHGSLPRWIGWMGLPAVALLLVAYTAFLGAVLFFLWVASVAVVALVRPVTARGGTAASTVT